MREFSYSELWALEEHVSKPHRIRAEALGIRIADLPVTPALTKLEDSMRRIDSLYNLLELEEEGLKVRELLQKHTEMQLLDFLETNGCELSITMEEVENLLLDNEVIFGCEVYSDGNQLGDD